ncbi:MAG: hypothetical protein H3C63_14935 [Candidatus Omnitrophica bacterium]|nr:hypothetical protein [Candidatus Omnitrophota bacterium]
MFSRSKKLLVVLSVLAVSLLIFAGAALAQEPAPTMSDAEGKTPVQQTQEWMGAEAWGGMIQQMTRIHGAQATGEMIQEMNESGSCHGGSVMGTWGDMMGNWNGEGAWNTVMGGGMMNGFGR